MKGTHLKDGPEYVFESFIKHGWNDDGQLKLLVKWFGFPEGEATWKFASSLPREAPRKYCLRMKIKLPALTREEVYFSDQVKKRVQDLQVAWAVMEIRVTKKRGSAPSFPTEPSRNLFHSAAPTLGEGGEG